jgi:hypothetical protein
MLIRVFQRRWFDLLLVHSGLQLLHLARWNRSHSSPFMTDEFHTADFIEICLMQQQACGLRSNGLPHASACCLDPTA